MQIPGRQVPVYVDEKDLQVLVDALRTYRGLVPDAADRVAKNTQTASLERAAQMADALFEEWKRVKLWGQ